jgi:predicted RNA-binding Zn ribbon-like protein
MVRILEYEVGINKQTRGQGADPTFPRLLGKRLCLDFVNTIESPRLNPEDYLQGYPALIRWGRHVGILTNTEVDDLLREGVRQPDEAAAVFELAFALREALTRIFRATAHGNTAAESDLQQVQAEYLAALNHARLMPIDDGYDWRWNADDMALDSVLWPIARSALVLLTTDDLARIKECPGADDCGWLFYDTSKNNSRRWCSMEGCGSRVKMRRQYARRPTNDPQTET